MALPIARTEAQSGGSPFAQEASQFLETELPKMRQAVAAQDRGYFEGAMARTLDFADRWGFKTRVNEALVSDEACTNAVSDLVVVGLCQLSPSASDCAPALASTFERNREACRALANR